MSEKMAYYQKVTDQLSAIGKRIPAELYVKSRLKAALSIGMISAITVGSILLMAFLSSLPAIVKWPIGLLVGWFVLGTALSGAFSIAHDAGHRSLYASQRANNFWGHVFSGIVGWPFHLWRYSHFLHHKFTNNAEFDVAWEPYTQEKIDRMPLFFKRAYVMIRSNEYLLWLGGVFHLLDQFIKFSRGKRFPAEERAGIKFSIAVTGLIFCSYMAVSLCFGAYGFICMFLVPVCRYYQLLTVFTMLHHLSPKKNFVPNRLWKDNIGAIQLLGTINVHYGAFIDFLSCNVGSWHIPHHVSVAVPHYNLKKATFALREAYPGLLHEEKYSRGYLREILGTCQAVDKDLNWKQFKKS